uniref:Uncharacterized protein n=1 Tax=Arundo donax TaxID=35708 RepID=A0A0A9HB46_ARUDO
MSPTFFIEVKGAYLISCDFDGCRYNLPLSTTFTWKLRQH